MSEFFKYLKTHELFFQREGQKVTYKKGQYLVMASEPSKWVFFLLEGNVGVSFTFNDGVDRLVGYFIPGMTFAQSGSFYDDEGGGLEYQACKDATVLRVPRQLFLNQLSQDKSFNAEYVEAVLRNQIYLIDRIVYQGEKGMRAKCIRWLLFMAKYYGNRNGKSVTISIPVTQEIAANFMHSTRESASTTLGDLKKKSLISTKNKYITIHNVEKLKKELE